MHEYCKEDTVEFVAERIERRLAETKADIEARIAAMETRLTWRLFAFWIGQAAFLRIGESLSG
ncbi:hypothetical protein E308F_11280 [Moorella sp. E308F]|uniref:hypothetical protein n=1 Tax=Moorella sp. E308F TaxID=2572682 RepID=UPI0010FFAEA4|nr:hypothetical protein [Moorella sp. E308F]GEA14884.1 hypothetical protein E308F_11280 [Moorella sp. E308F]